MSHTRLTPSNGRRLGYNGSFIEGNAADQEVFELPAMFLCSSLDGPYLWLIPKLLLIRLIGPIQSQTSRRGASGRVTADRMNRSPRFGAASCCEAFRRFLHVPNTTCLGRANCPTLTPGQPPQCRQLCHTCLGVIYSITIHAM